MAICLIFVVFQYLLIRLLLLFYFFFVASKLWCNKALRFFFVKWPYSFCHCCSLIKRALGCKEAGKIWSNTLERSSFLCFFYFQCCLPPPSSFQKLILLECTEELIKFWALQEQILLPHPLLFTLSHGSHSTIEFYTSTFWKYTTTSLPS